MILRLPWTHRYACSGLLTLLAAVSVGGCDADPTAPGAPAALAGPLSSATVTPAVDIYVSAHQDDWQLFAGDRFATSARGAVAKMVVVYTSAGDANRVATFWQAREVAAGASVDTLIGAGPWTCAVATVNAHPIQRCTKGKVVSYFMRVPDGNINGDGYGAGSLKLLQAGTRTLTAKDGSTTYASWADFTATLRAIIVNEAGGNASPFVQVYAPEYDRTINPSDHDDHFRTGEATRAAMQDLPYDLGWYVGYYSQHLAANVAGAELAWKKAEFWRYSQAMGKAGFGSPYSEPIYHTWMARTYVRHVDYVPPGPPAAPTDVSATATHAAATVTWTDNSSDETLFRVERAPDAAGMPGTFAAAGTAPSNAVTFTDAAVAPETGYWYRIRSESNGGASAYTSPVQVTTAPLPAPPAPPADLQASALSGSRIDLSWSDAAVNEESYQLERAPDVGGAPGAFAPRAALPPNGAAYSDTDLQPNTAYWYRLRAVNAGGPSPWVTISAATSAAFDVDVYVQAYQDDWQVFAGDRVSSSLQTAQRVVLVFTTAGDAGRVAQYWLTRERASRASVDTLIGAGGWTCAPEVVASHPIQRCEKGKVVAYYMRMPDAIWGEGSGKGSLTHLKRGQPTTALDSSTTYASWADFTTTLRTLVATETGGQTAPFAEINAPEYDKVVSPSDRADRYSTGEAVLAASQGQGWTIAWYVGRHSQNLPQNVSGAAYDAKVRAFQAYDKVMRAGGYGSTWYEVQAWLSRTYFRLVAGS